MRTVWMHHEQWSGSILVDIEPNMLWTNSTVSDINLSKSLQILHDRRSRHSQVLTISDHDDLPATKQEQSCVGGQETILSSYLKSNKTRAGGTDNGNDWCPRLLELTIYQVLQGPVMIRLVLMSSRSGMLSSLRSTQILASPILEWSLQCVTEA